MQPLVPHEVVVDADALDALWASLGDELRDLDLQGLDDDSLERVVRVVDTFDWRLWSADLRLLVTRSAGPEQGAGRRTGQGAGQGTGQGTQRRALLLDRDGDVRQRQRLAEPRPPFAVDLPAGPLRDAVAPRTEPRRLLELVELRQRVTTRRVVDSEEKTVVRIERVESTAVPVAEAPRTGAVDGAVELAPRLRLRPVRGYDDAFATVRRLLGAHRLTPPPGDLLEEALRAVGLEPGAYQAKPKLDFEPSEPAAEAARRIHRHLLGVLVANEDGTRRDLDSEFLHDFRVAVRRTRSALSQIKGVFPADHLEHFKNEMRWLGGVTGPTRDLDVYLLKMPAYRDSLPATIADDLEPLQRFLVAHQRSEQASLARTLRSARYRKLLADWRRFLEEPPDDDLAADSSTADTPHAARPIRAVASERIWKSFRRVVKRGGRIDDGSPDDALHDLRKDCKKLRYLLEFFASLYPQDEIDAAVKELKRLQDVLGDFNDYSVQQESLRDFAHQMASEESAAAHDAPIDTLLAMGHLLAHLADGQSGERRRFAKRFRRFAAADNQNRFRRLFKA